MLLTILVFIRLHTSATAITTRSTHFDNSMQDQETGTVFRQNRLNRLLDS